MSALATVDFKGEEVDAAWEKMKQSPAATDYLSELPPGHVQSSSEPLVERSGVALREHHLAILSFKVYEMDWLALSKDGHRRAKLMPTHSVEWLVP